MMYRQGDVLITAHKIPTDAAEHRSEDIIILVRGEATGHHHAVSARHAVMYMLGTAMYLRCLRETELKHQEHDPIILPAGDYVVTRQREYTPGEVRNVQD